MIFRSGTHTMDEFYRIKRLPPYVFAIVNDLKAKARARGEDIIDLGMGNPDQATPPHGARAVHEDALGRARSDVDAGDQHG